MSRRRIGLAVAAAFAPGGCAGVQSALAPTGEEADRVALLFWVMTASAAAIAILVALLTIVAMYGRGRLRTLLADERTIIGGGIVFPVVTLSLLLGYGLVVTSANPVSLPAEGSLRVAVVGEQWWWRVRYKTPDARTIESANEIRIPVGQPVQLELTAADVIHSLWIPNLAGKLDMIPGRTNVLRLRANEAGVSRGQCAEYCGGAHALMSLFVVVMGESEFQDWLEREASLAVPPADAAAERGARLFQDTGCGACHSVRGTPATGKVGPDLTHVGGRRSLAAATLPNDAPAFARWIRDNQHIKPDNKMPPYRIFGEQELADLAVYLEGLK